MTNRLLKKGRHFADYDMDNLKKQEGGICLEFSIFRFLCLLLVPDSTIEI